MSLKDVPMMTTDECEITLNMIIYQAYYRAGYDFKNETKSEISAHRVISLDNSRRHFRTRCIKGCETEYSMAQGKSCSENLFGKIESAKKYLDEIAQSNFDKCTSKLKQVTDTRNGIAGQRSIIKKMKPSDIREPKAV